MSREIDPEYLDRENLEKLQLKRLKKVLDRVYHKVPFYREAFDERKVKPR